MATATKTKTKANEHDLLAAHYAADILHGALLEAGEPVKASEASRIAGRDDVDLKLARVILSTHPDRFTATDRKWTLWTRFAGPERALERNLEEILEKYGLPAKIGALARELEAIYKRPADVYQEMLSRILTNRDRYFKTPDGRYGLTRWLLKVDSDKEEDVLFDNYLKPFDIAPYEKSAKGLDPANLDSVVEFLDKAGEPVANLVVQFVAWKAKPARFNPAAFVSNLLQDGRAVFLSGGSWIGPKAAGTLAEQFPRLAEKEVDEYGDHAAAEVSQPLVISDDDTEQLIAGVLKNERTSHARRLLEDVFEVTASESTYEGDLKTVVDALKSAEGIAWVGADRFLPESGIPPYVFTIPENLQIPVVHYVDAEGNDLDVILEDDGYDGGLQRDTLSPLAQDVLDEEPVYTPEPNPPSTARCVLKLHHKEVGTLPLCQLAPGFFSVEPNIIQVDMTLPSGHKTEVWINNETRLVYGLLEWYHTLPVDSGAVFYLERQAPDRYAITYGEETEPAMFISRNRVNELIDLGQRAEAEELPSFDLIREIMEHYRKGIEYITLLTEVNIARRTTRRLAASLLSAYHCFFQRGGAWVYDAKKLSQGFDRSKRKYLRK